MKSDLEYVLYPASSSGEFRWHIENRTLLADLVSNLAL